MFNFDPTHLVGTPDGDEYYIMLLPDGSGRAYTEESWECPETPDFVLDGGTWLGREGKPFDGVIEKIHTCDGSELFGGCSCNADPDDVLWEVKFVPEQSRETAQKSGDITKYATTLHLCEECYDAVDFDDNEWVWESVLTPLKVF